MAHSEQVKAAVITAVVSGTPLSRVAVAHGVARATIYRWLADLPEYPGNDQFKPICGLPLPTLAVSVGSKCEQVRSWSGC